MSLYIILCTLTAVILFPFFPFPYSLNETLGCGLFYNTLNTHLDALA